jgi:hypothetical protein
LVISFVLLLSPNPLEIFAAVISFSLAILSASSFAFLAYSCVFCSVIEVNSFLRLDISACSFFRASSKYLL